MKYIKLLMLIVTVSLFASCSDDDDYNTQEVTVGFEKDVTVTKENADLIQIPILVNGSQRNGDITLKIAVEPTGAEPAIADSMFYLTSDVFRIPADSLVKSVNVEMRILDDRIPTASREFKLNIVQCNGAKLGIASTLVQIIDNDGDEYAYDSMFGKYDFTLNFNNGQADQDFTAQAKMSGALFPEDYRYNKELVLTTSMDLGFGTGALNYTYKILFEYDHATKQGQLGVKMAEQVAEFALSADKLLNWQLFNSEGSEGDPIYAEFSMEQAPAKNAAGQIIPGVMYNVPSNMQFANTAALFRQVNDVPDMKGDWGMITFKSLNYKR